MKSPEHFRLASRRILRIQKSDETAGVGYMTELFTWSTHDESCVSKSVHCAGSSERLNIESRRELLNSTTSDPESTNLPKTTIGIENEPERNAEDSETTFDVRVNSRSETDDSRDT